ncbi:MAG: hypothetical protein RMK81_11245 [Geminicoccaceae bacterium]|nr:hypothetical protein [Gammaproteobacteria bacterium]MDW8370838.1 hypothetical protein [Geminicoccaceae bacterium]
MSEPEGWRFDEGLFEGYALEHGTVAGGFWTVGDKIRYRWAYFDGRTCADGAGELGPGEKFENLVYEDLMRMGGRGWFSKEPGQSSFTIVPRTEEDET